VGHSTASDLHARASRQSSIFLNAPFFWPGLIQAGIAWPVILCRLGWTLYGGREGGIRTRDLSVPNRARYQASLLPDVVNVLLDVRCTRFLGPEPRPFIKNSS
jgi:hypothetical protein